MGERKWGSCNCVSQNSQKVILADFVRAQCSVPGVSGSKPAKINIFIIIALVSLRNIV